MLSIIPDALYIILRLILLNGSSLTNYSKIKIIKWTVYNELLRDLYCKIDPVMSNT